LNVDPRVLPYDACTKAAENVDRMIGIPIQEFRHAVVEQLPGPLGCTHLNDALRALAEVPMLVTSLQYTRMVSRYFKETGHRKGTHGSRGARRYSTHRSSDSYTT
jgi:hypothetical protein